MKSALPPVIEYPLGKVAIDREGIAGIADLPQVIISDEAHAQEHSLEVQLPFLQTVLGDFLLLPLVVGEASTEDVAEILERRNLKAEEVAYIDR